MKNSNNQPIKRIISIMLLCAVFSILIPTASAGNNSLFLSILDKSNFDLNAIEIDDLLLAKGYLDIVIDERLDKGEQPNYTISDTGLGKSLPSPDIRVSGTVRFMNVLFNVESNNNNSLYVRINTDSADVFTALYTMAMCGYGFKLDSAKKNNMLRTIYFTNGEIDARLVQNNDSSFVLIASKTENGDKSNTSSTSKTSTNSANVTTAPSTKGSEMPAIPASFSGKSINVNANGRSYVVRKDFKDAMDDYEAYFDNYIELMKKIGQNSQDYLNKYMAMMEKYQELSTKLDAINDLTDDETAYYTYVLLKINQKVLAAMK